MSKKTIKRIGKLEKKYIQEVLVTEFRNSKNGTMISRLERAFADKIGTKYAISHVNGTCTLHSALEAAGIGIGDEVIVPPLTMASTSLAVLHANATPIFADVDPKTFVISPESIKNTITTRTKAIITVSLYGLSPQMDPIMKIAKDNNLIVIEDNAQCFLGKYKNKYVGTFGDMASFSFQSSKHMTSGEGGILVTDNEDISNKIRCFQSLGYAGISGRKGKITKEDIQDPNYSRHILLGWNYRMPELCAAVALAQLERLELLVQRRIDVAKEYEKIVKSCNWLQPQYIPPECIHSFWSYCIKMDIDRVPWQSFRKKYLEFGGDGIYAAWKLTYKEPMFQQHAFSGREQLIKPYIQDYTKQICPVAEELQPKLLQFKTNYWNWKDAERNFNALTDTINLFEKL